MNGTNEKIIVLAGKCQGSGGSDFGADGNVVKGRVGWKTQPLLSVPELKFQVPKSSQVGELRGQIGKSIVACLRARPPSSTPKWGQRGKK